MEEIGSNIKDGLADGRMIRGGESGDNTRQHHPQHHQQQHPHQQHPQHQQRHQQHPNQRTASANHPLQNVGSGTGEIDEEGISSHYIQESFDKINEAIGKIEGEKLGTINQELSYLRHVMDYQNTKIEKLTGIMADFLENKNQNAIINSLQTIQDNDGDTNTAAAAHLQSEVRGGQGTAPEHLDVSTQGGGSGSAGGAGGGPGAAADSLAAHQDPETLNNSAAAVHLDSNMDPQLHQVAAAAVQQAEEHVVASDLDKYRKKIFLKRKLSGGDLVAGHSDPQDPSRESKRPKISINFLHNPMTVKEIYDEYTKGFRGQPPLCEMDSRFGKHEWRGDSRSKESKRFQRRKKLCDAITRGMQKYDKSAEEIIRYIEEFRGDKSLTWVMNGNLPPDLNN